MIVLLNKTDLVMKTTTEMVERMFSKPTVGISAREESGFDRLADLLEEMFLSGSISYEEESYLTSIRHRTAMKEAKESLKKVLESIDCGLPEDFYSIDLMDAYESLGKIVGESVGEDLVNEIFRKFCVGK